MSTTTETRQLTITLPARLADEVQAKVASGEFANEAEVIEAALDALTLPAEDPGLDHWIATEGVRRYNAMIADPSQCLTLEQLNAALDADEQEDALTELRKAG